MDTAIWATWYDLPDDAADHHGWLHGEYLPALAAQPGILWAAHYQNTGGGEVMRRAAAEVVTHTQDVPGTGKQFVVLVGASTPHTFFDPYIMAQREKADASVRAQLDRRVGVMECVFTEEHRVDGPEVGERSPGGTPGPAIQFGTFIMSAPEHDFPLGEWYAGFRLPAMARMPGCIAARKLICVAGWAKHAVLYEFTSLEARMEHFETTHESKALEPGNWSNKVVRHTIHAPASPVVGPRLWPVI